MSGVTVLIEVYDRFINRTAAIVRASAAGRS
jgi:hypothetical protein